MKQDGSLYSIVGLPATYLYNYLCEQPLFHTTDGYRSSYADMSEATGLSKYIIKQSCERLIKHGYLVLTNDEGKRHRIYHIGTLRVEEVE